MKIGWRVRCALLLLPGLGACGLTSPGVVRVMNGREVEGRYISVGAYAAYARALEEDPESIQIRVRLAAVACSLNADVGDGEFAEIEALSSDFEPLWRERALCAKRRRDLKSAVRAAERAAALDPDRPENSLLLAELYERTGRVQDARRWLNGLTARRPDSRTAWQALSGFAQRQGDTTLALRAREVLERVPPGLHRRREPGTLKAMDQALRTGDLEQARSLSHNAHMPADELALRAAALGVPGAAREQAELVLGADDGNVNAWVALLSAADQLRDEETFRRALNHLAQELPPPSALAVRVLAELMARRTGAEAARAFLVGYGKLPAPRDTLEKRLDARLDGNTRN